MDRRVVITGLGTVNPLGNCVDDFWRGLREGRCGIGTLTKFDTSDFTVKIAAEVKDFDPALYLDKKAVQRMDVYSKYAVCASVEAARDAGFKNGFDGIDAGVVLGNGFGGLASTEEGFDKLSRDCVRRIPILTIPKMLSSLGAGNIALALGIHGPCFAVNTACASGTDAIGNAFGLILSGAVEVALAGGAEAGITKLCVGGFCALQALTISHNDNPEAASRPFEKGRDGFVMGEGAGMLVLEEYEHAIRRGARIYCELVGYGSSCDAYHITAPDPAGSGAIKALKSALGSAGIKPCDVDYVNAHGTSTQLGDKVETFAIKSVFGEYAEKLKVSSIKGMVGHCIGAAGGIEAVASVLSIRDQWLPPTINYEEQDPECNLDYIPNQGINHRTDVVVSNSFGFGGHNAVIILRRI